jgi:hypothetical protein
MVYTLYIAPVGSQGGSLGLYIPKTACVHPCAFVCVRMGGRIDECLRLREVNMSGIWAYHVSSFSSTYVAPDPSAGVCKDDSLAYRSHFYRRI